MKLIYDANLTYLVSMSILSDEGEIIAAQPFSRMKSSAAPKKKKNGLSRQGRKLKTYIFQPRMWKICL